MILITRLIKNTGNGVLVDLHGVAEGGPDEGGGQGEVVGGGDKKKHARSAVTSESLKHACADGRDFANNN